MPVQNSKRYSIFGEDNAFMDYGYVPISNIERNNKGFYTVRKVKIEKPKQLSVPSISVPVWLLPFLNEPEEKKDFKDSKLDDDNEKFIEDLEVGNTINQTDSFTKTYTFNWPYEGNHVALTGDFDNWAGSIQMTPVISNEKKIFKTTLNNLDSSKDIQYKFIVDGIWCFDINQDNIKHEDGIINNVIYASKF